MRSPGHHERSAAEANPEFTCVSDRHACDVIDTACVLGTPEHVDARHLRVSAVLRRTADMPWRVASPIRQDLWATRTRFLVISSATIRSRRRGHSPFGLLAEYASDDDRRAPAIEAASTGFAFTSRRRTNVRRASSLKLIAGLAAAGLALAACSSGSSSTPSTAQQRRQTSAASSGGIQFRREAASTGPARPPVGRLPADRGQQREMTGDPSIGQGRPGLRHRRSRGPVVQRLWPPPAWTRPRPRASTVVGELTAGRRRARLGQGGPAAPADRQRRHRRPRRRLRLRRAGGRGRARPIPTCEFAIVDDAAGRPCRTSPRLTFAEEQGSYLVGVAAALKTKTNKVGFIGGVNVPLIQKFQAGFEAGVKATNPDARSRPSTSPSRRTSPASTRRSRARRSPTACTTTASTSSTPPRAVPAPACSRPPRPPGTWASASTPTSTTGRRWPTSRTSSSPRCSRGRRRDVTTSSPARSTASRSPA